MQIAIGILLIIAAVFLVVAVLMQSGKSHNLSGTIAGGAETFFGKGKAKGLDAKLAKITKIAAIAFIVLAIACTIVVSHIDNGNETAIQLTEEELAAVEAGEAHLHEDGSIHYGDHTEAAEVEAPAEEPAVEAPAEETPAEEAAAE